MSEPGYFLPRAAAVAAATVLAALLSSCGGDYDNCYSCGNNNATPAEYSAGVISADLTGAGLPDVVAISSLHPWSPPTGDLETYLATSTGVYGGASPTADGDSPLYIGAADLTGNGLTDVVTASYDDGTLNVFLNNKLAPGTFNPPLVLSSPGASQLAIADVNGDGLPDLVSADFNVSLFLQTSAGTFASPITLYSGGANWVAVGDLNHDGAPDIALTDNTGVHVLLHTGATSATTYAAPVTVFTPTANMNVQGSSLIAIADVNGDGFNDLIITDPGPTGGAAPTVNVLLQNPAAPGTFLAPVSYPIAAQDLPQSILVSSLGSALLTSPPDIIIGGQQHVTVLLHNPATPGTFLPASIYNAAGANEIAIADINGDGLPDIVVSNGITNPVVNGVITTHPGVLLQSAATPGTFGAIEDLP